MKKRTTIEMTLVQCPACGAYTDKLSGLCQRCGASTTVSESFTKEEEDGIMPEGAPVQYPTVKVNSRERRTITLDNKLKLFAITCTMFNFGLFSLGASGDGDYTKALIAWCLAGFLWFLFGFVYWLDIFLYNRIKKRGHSVKGIILGYNNVSKINADKGRYSREAETIQMQVFARIKNRDTIVFITAPVGVSELSHPRETEVTLYEYNEEYIVEV